MKFDDLNSRLLDQIGFAALRFVRPAIRSATLRDAVRWERLTDRVGRLFIPHYWAIYQHDGRGRVRPRSAVWLVWFVDPADDPRLSGGYPVKLSDVRRLTRDEFMEGLARNREMRADNPSGGDQQFMRIREVSAPTSPGASYPFFEKGMQNFPSVAKQIIDNFMMARLGEIAVNERSSATIKL